MLKRLNVTIFHPRMIAKLIIDKFLMIFFFFSVLFFLVGSASFLSTYKVKSITNVNKQYFLNQIKQQEVKNNFKMENFIMKNDNAFSVKVGVVNYNFGNDTSTNDYIVFDFLEDQVEIKCMGIKMIYFTYEELNAANFDINDGIKNVNFSNGFLFLIDATTIKLNEFLLPINFILSYVIEIFTFILIFILIFILTLRFNPAIRGIFRFKIVLYACTPFLLCKLFGLLFGITDLSIIGMLLSYFYATSALRAVLKIEVKKV